MKKVWLFIGIWLLVLNQIPQWQAENQYKQACKLLEEGSYDEALACFESLDDYKDAAEKRPETKLKMTSNAWYSHGGILDTKS